MGHYNRLLYKDEVDPKLLTRGFTKEQIELMMAKKRSSITELISCNLHFKKGLQEYNHPYFSYFMTLHQNYKLGVLPFSGSLSEQPAYIMEIFDIMDQLDFEKDKKIQQEQQAEMKKQGRK